MRKTHRRHTNTDIHIQMLHIALLTKVSGENYALGALFSALMAEQKEKNQSVAGNDLIIEKLVSPLKDDDCTVEHDDSQDLHCNVDRKPKLLIICNKTARSASL